MCMYMYVGGRSSGTRRGARNRLVRHSKAPPVDLSLWRKHADCVARFWERLVDATGFQAQIVKITLYSDSCMVRGLGYWLFRISCGGLAEAGSGCLWPGASIVKVTIYIYDWSRIASQPALSALSGSLNWNRIDLASFYFPVDNWISVIVVITLFI